MNATFVKRDHGWPPIRPLWWDDGALAYPDQRSLPQTIRVARATSVGAAIDALTSGAIGGSRYVDVFSGFAAVLAGLHPAGERPTHIAALRLAAAAAAGTDRLEALERVLRTPEDERLRAAETCSSENFRIDRAIAGFAASLLPERGNVVTLGATGALATGGFGTACGAIVEAHRAGNTLHAFVAETRPRETGTRLTACELRAAGVSCTLVADAAAAALMIRTAIGAVIGGAGAIAANGDTTAELGTLQMAIIAAHFRVPFYIAAPRNAIAAGSRTAAATSLDAHSDVTPGHLITAIVTEYGICRPPYDESLAILASRPRFALIGATALSEADASE